MIWIAIKRLCVIYIAIKRLCVIYIAIKRLCMIWIAIKRLCVIYIAIKRLCMIYIARKRLYTELCVQFGGRCCYHLQWFLFHASVLFKGCQNIHTYILYYWPESWLFRWLWSFLYIIFWQTLLLIHKMQNTGIHKRFHVAASSNKYLFFKYNTQFYSLNRCHLANILWSGSDNKHIPWWLVAAEL